MQEKYGPFEEEEHKKQVEEERIEKEKIHGEVFIGTSTLEELIDKIHADYRDYVKRDRIENPWRYTTENADLGVPPER